jgi:hypothetical protein
MNLPDPKSLPALNADSYGVTEQRAVVSDLDKASEQLVCLGYCVLDAGYPVSEVDAIRRLFDMTHEQYLRRYGEELLRELDEHNTIRLPLALEPRFITLATNSRVLDLAARLIRNKFILNQQNGIINPPGETYNQGKWHRDLPYQHFTSTRPLAINALYCIDEFTAENGATYVLPGSHLQEAYPSDEFVMKEARQVTAPAGSFIILHGMLFHRGGANRTTLRRRAMNHVYTTAFIRQQVDMRSAFTDPAAQPAAVAELLGFKYQIPRTVAEYLQSRRR